MQYEEQQPKCVQNFVIRDIEFMNWRIFNN